MDAYARLARRLKLHELRVLLAAAQTGSLAKAAGQLALTQPAISKTVAELEAKLGLRLLDRTARGVAPTAEGKVLIARALNIFAELRHVTEEFESMADPSAGELRVVGAPLLVAGFLPRVLTRLAQDRPGLRYHVLEVDPEGQFRALRTRVADIMVGRKPPGVQGEGITFEPLFEEKLFIVGGVNHPLVRKLKVTGDDLRQQRWILPLPDTSIGRLTATSLAALDVPTERPAVTSMSMLLRFQLLATGQFLTTLPGSLLHLSEMGPMLRPLPFDLPQGASDVGLASLRDVSLPPVARLFAQYAREVAKPLTNLDTTLFGRRRRKAGR
ncbi:MAG: LysR family transcriptional regulator [Burkholderiales bacterium]